MAARPLRPGWQAHLAPLRATLPLALCETALGYGLIVLCVGVLQLASDSPLVVVFTILALLWLALWPAWRLRPIGHGPWWVRLVKGSIRAIATAVLLALFGWLLSRLLSPPLFNLLGRGATAVVIPCFFAFRLMVVMGEVFSHPVRSRLRWQLMASHVAVIVLTVATLTSIGSVIGFALIEHGITPDPSAMAVSVADDLRLARSVAPFDVRRTDEILYAIERGRLPLRGEPPLTGFVRSPLLPGVILLARPDGHVLTAVNTVGDRRVPRVLPASRAWSDLFGSSGAAWKLLRRRALSDQPGALSSQSVPGQKVGGYLLAEAPVRGPGGTLDTIVVLQLATVQPSSRQSVQAVVALFGVTTIALIGITALPMLALSFLFSYLVARGLTRRLESVSHVATSIASGDLAQRAPVTSRNEVGQLAEDINRMAMHLETTMGELRQARSQAEEALRRRQELVVNISHELRNPLAILRAHLETLTMMRDAVQVGATGTALDEDVTVPAATLGALETETERLELLVDDLFALSRVQAGGLQVRQEPVDVARLVHEVAAVMRPLARREGMIALSVEAQPDLPYALADSDRLRQIISNLVRNAVRHTPEGGIIVLSVTADGSYVVVSVADTGEGIAPEHLPYIFERFYRVDQARSRGSGGAGLGLAIVQEFAELMGGRVEVESSPGEGTCFRVFLPGARDQAPGPSLATPPKPA